MSTTYDDAVEALYRGSLDAFVAERKRLAGELKASGDKVGAARLAKLGRPSLSAWVANQLYWHEREAFDRLLAAAARLRKGELDAQPDHQRALSALRTLASARLAEGGHGTSEATLRRVTMTLSALAATGNFDPDPPGALVADRDPPGFDAMGLVEIQAIGRRTQDEPKRADPKRREQQEAERAEQERKRAEEERRRIEEERARRRAERERLAVSLRAAEMHAATLERETRRLRSELGAAETRLQQAETEVAKLRAALSALN